MGAVSSQSQSPANYHCLKKYNFKNLIENFTRQTPAQLAPLPSRAESIGVRRAIVAVAVLRETGAVLAFLATAAERIIETVTTFLQTGTILALFSSATKRIVKAVTAFCQAGTIFAFFSPSAK